jgi:hypothetical protein
VSLQALGLCVDGRVSNANNIPLVDGWAYRAAFEKYESRLGLSARIRSCDRQLPIRSSSQPRSIEEHMHKVDPAEPNPGTTVYSNLSAEQPVGYRLF